MRRTWNENEAFSYVIITALHRPSCWREGSLVERLRGASHGSVDGVAFDDGALIAAQLI